MLLHILMNNTKDEIKNCFPIDYIHVLKMNQKGQKYLKTIKKTIVNILIAFFML